MKRLVFVMIFMLIPSFASAQMTDDDVTEIVPDTDLPRLQDPDRQGFDGKLSVAANLNLADNRDVVGQQNGLSTLFGLQLISGLDYLYKRHEVRNTLTITESWARTPTIPQFVKNTDTVELESLYNYFLLSWFGAFGRLALNTSLFETELVTADPVSYQIARNDGTVEGPLPPTTSVTLSDPFQPFSLYESIGVFAEAFESVPFNLRARVGFGSRQTFADGVLAEDDNDDTDFVELQELENVFQAGAEGFIGITGAFSEKRFTYDFGGSVLIPFISNDETDRSATELTRLALVGKVAMSLTEWASLNYQLRVLDDPQLIDDVQVQNALLLTFQYTFIERDGGDAEPTAEEKLAAAEAKLEAAREECEELEKEAQEAKREAEEAKRQEEAAEEAAAEAAAEKAAAEKAAREAEAAEEAESAEEPAEGSEDPAGEEPAEQTDGETREGDANEPTDGAEGAE